MLYKTVPGGSTVEKLGNRLSGWSIFADSDEDVDVNEVDDAISLRGIRS